MNQSDKKIVREIAALPERLTHLTRPLVFTNGCFDILHRGHIDYLEKAAALGKSLLIGVNSDASVKRQGKGKERPINPLDDRMAVLAALACVDLVVPFDEDEPLDLIHLVKPDILVKGGDWSAENIVGADFVTKHGGQVRSIPFKYQRSTTTIIQRIRQHG